MLSKKASAAATVSAPPPEPETWPPSPPNAQFIVIGLSGSPYIRVYPWTSAGLGAAGDYSGLSGIAIAVNSVHVSSNGGLIVAGTTASPRIHLWNFDAMAGGWGGKYANPGALPPGPVNQVRMANNHGIIAAYGNTASSTASTLTLFSFSTGAGAGLVWLDQSASWSNGGRYGCKWDKDSNSVILGGSQTSNRAIIFTTGASPYVLNSSTPTVNLTDQGVNQSATGMAFHPTQNVVALGINSTATSTKLYAWGWADKSLGSSFPSYTTPSGSYWTGVNDMSFSNSGNVVFLALGLSATGNVGSHIAAVKWDQDTGFGTLYSNPATTPGGNGIAIVSSYNDGEVLMRSTNSPYLHAYQWSYDTGFGTKYSIATSVGTPTNSACISLAFGTSYSVT